MIGFAMCASYCTHKDSLKLLHSICQKHEVIPILSENAYSTDTRFGTAAQLILELETITGHKVIHTIKDAEPLGPVTALECLIICPCTGNTLAKIASGITDTSVTMAAKAHLRSDRPLLITLASNDAMCANLKNIAELLNKKNVYFTPLQQDDIIKKPHSLVADFSKAESALEYALKRKQMRPLFLEANK